MRRQKEIVYSHYLYFYVNLKGKYIWRHEHNWLSILCTGNGNWWLLVAPRSLTSTCWKPRSSWRQVRAAGTRQCEQIFIVIAARCYAQVRPMPSCSVCPSVWRLSRSCIVSKRPKMRPQFNANRKPYPSFRTVPFSMILSVLAKYSMTRIIAQSLCDSWASCTSKQQ